MNVFRVFVVGCLVFGVTVATHAQAPFTAKLELVPGMTEPKAFNFEGMSAYWPNVVYKDDLYILYYHGGGPSNTGNGWTWKPVTCPNMTAPDANGPRECNDRVFMAWKHVSCAIGGACGQNKHWNVYPGISNYSVDKNDTTISGNTNYFTWLQTGTPPPPVQRMVGFAESQQLGQQPCAGTTKFAKYAGAGTPAVIHVREHNRWYMAFDAGIHFGHGEDTHRIAWSTSSDGVNWSAPKLLYIDASETAHCGAGALVNTLYFENGMFYMLVTSLGNQQLFLLRSPYSSDSATGFDIRGWSAADGKDASDNLIYPDTTTALPNIPLGSVANFDQTSGNFWPIAPHGTGATPTRGTIAKVYAGSTSSSYRYVLIVDHDPASVPTYPTIACAAPDPTRPMWTVYLSDKLEKFMTVFDSVYPADNTTGYSRGEYGWQPTIPWLVPDANYTRVYSPVTTFINYCTTDQPERNANNVARVRLRLCGDIFNAQCP